VVELFFVNYGCYFLSVCNVAALHQIVYLFPRAINEYDMKLEEDDNTNRLIESLKLWKALTSTDFFKPIPFMLFLNKSDLFKYVDCFVSMFSRVNSVGKKLSESHSSPYSPNMKSISRRKK
jgi:hypothetical protein